MSVPPSILTVLPSCGRSKLLCLAFLLCLSSTFIFGPSAVVDGEGEGSGLKVA